MNEVAKNLQTVLNDEEDMDDLSNFRPKAYAIDYYLILNNCLRKFFEDHNSEFVLVDKVYTYAGKSTVSYFEKIFSQYIFDEIFRLIDEIDKENQNQKIKKYYIIDSCLPVANALAKLDRENNILYSAIPDEALVIKYYLLEKDLQIDIVALQDAWDNIFNKLFSAKKKQNNIFFLKHSNLDFIQLKNILGLVFGKNNVIDYSDRQLGDDGILCLGGLNNKLTLSVDRIMTVSKDLNNIVEEVKEFINDSLRI